MTFEAFVSAILPSLCVSVIMLIFNTRQEHRDRQVREAEQRRRLSERIQISLLLAVSKLAYAVAMAYKRGQPNGEMEEALEQYREAITEFKKFERELVADAKIDM